MAIKVDYKVCQTINNPVSNCNSSTTGTIFNWRGASNIIDSSKMFDVSSDWITVKRDCRVLANCTLFLESSSTRPNVWIEFTINWNRQNVMSASAYIRHAAWHNEASDTLTQVLELSAWDKVWIIMFRMAGAWTVTATGWKSALSLTVLNE